MNVPVSLKKSSLQNHMQIIVSYSRKIQRSSKMRKRPILYFKKL